MQTLDDEPSYPGGLGYFAKQIGVNDNKGFFAVAKMISVPLRDLPEDADNRCDRGSVGPSGFHIWDADKQVCVCGSTDEPDEVTRDHAIRVSDLVTGVPVIEAIPFGFIIYVELKNEELENEAIRWPHHTRTLQEMFRYIVEWAWAHDELGNREEIAVVCRGIVDVLEMPNNIYEWIVSEIPPEKVGRFLQGHPDARARTTEVIPNMSDEFSAWLRTLMIECRTFGEYEKERTV